MCVTLIKSDAFTLRQVTYTYRLQLTERTFTPLFQDRLNIGAKKLGQPLGSFNLLRLPFRVQTRERLVRSNFGSSKVCLFKFHVHSS